MVKCCKRSSKLSKTCASIHLGGPPWDSSSKALGQDIAFSATLTMVLKVTRSGCSGVECIEDLQKMAGKTRRTWEKRQVEKSHNFSKWRHVVRQGRNDVAFSKKEMRIWFTKCRKSWKQNWSAYSRTTWTTTKLQARHNSSTARVHARAFLRMDPQNNVNSHPGHVISLSV